MSTQDTQQIDRNSMPNGNTNAEEGNRSVGGSQLPQGKKTAANRRLPCKCRRIQTSNVALDEPTELMNDPNEVWGKSVLDAFTNFNTNTKNAGHSGCHLHGC